MAYQSVNPATGEVGDSFPDMTDAQLDAAVASAATCFESWRNTTFAQRVKIAAKAAEIMRADNDRFARWMTLEMGKLFAQAQGEVTLSADIIDYYADHAEHFLAAERLTPSSGAAEILSEPIGVLLGVQPWNFPYYQLSRFAAPNIMAGNVVMVKHAGCVPQCAIAYEQLWRDAGAPPGLYSNLFISHDQVNRVIDDPRIKGVALTGSAEAGKLVAARAGMNLKKSTMELGGSDAFIVLDDADLDKAVEWGVWAKMNNNGQCCVAAKRFVIIDTLADQFLARFQSALEVLVPGDPMDTATTLGPMSTEDALLKLLHQVKQAVDWGAKLVMGGSRIDRPGSFMQPTILTDIATDNPAFREEFFGPVALFFRVADEDAAIALANDSDFGLGASVFTRDEGRGRRMAGRIDAGMVFINHPTWTAADLPFGGVKNSGYGRELSRMGIQEFVNKKLVRVAAIDAAA